MGGEIVNIAFDMLFAISESNDRGIGRYSRNMIDSIRNDQSHFYYYFYPEIHLGTDHLKTQLQEFLVQNSIDIYHVTSPFDWYLHNHVILSKEWFGKTKLAVTLYDIIPLIYSGVYLTDINLIESYLKILDFVKSCDFIFAISETTKRDAVHYVGMDPNKITVISGGIEEQFKVIRSFDRSDVHERYGIIKPYIMCTGGIDFRKNLNRLIEAFGQANRQLELKYQLVIVCRATELEKQYLRHIATNAGVSDSLILTGFVSDDDLVKLYNSAELFVFPSLYEGLGLPVLEAMSCGVPVLTSNTSSLDEVSGDAAYKVNPESIDDIAEGIVYLMKRSDLREEYRRKGLKHAAYFQWEKVGRKVLDAYKNP
jgi:glycosyltransferase involved in cell wall biosynthesis